MNVYYKDILYNFKPGYAIVANKDNIAFLEDGTERLVLPTDKADKVVRRIYHGLHYGESNIELDSLLKEV